MNKTLLILLCLLPILSWGETRAQFEKRMEENERKALQYKKETLPKVERFFIEEYIEKKKKHRLSLEKSYKLKKQQLKEAESPIQRNRLKKSLDEVQKKLEILYIYIDYSKAFHGLNYPKNAKEYSSYYKKVKSLRDKYKDLSGKTFPNFQGEYAKLKSKNKRKS